jgi:hypothetical protein
LLAIQRARKRQPAKAVALPPPVGGWDTKNSLADMPAKNAVILDNWFPETEQCTLRGGSVSHATGLGGSVETIIEHTKTDGTNKIFGCANGNIFDVTSAGAVGSAVVSGLANNKWQFVNFGTSGGQFTLAFNGADTPRTFNGSAWSTFGGTGPTVANCIWANVHHRRVWIGEKDSLSVWYGATNAITGTFTEFPLYGVFKKGGYIMAMGTWTRDSGEGVDDVAVFLTSEGEVAIYNGIDPSTASSWQLVGRFQIGRPVGRRCMVKAGGDLVMVTEDGFVSAQAILMTDRSQAERVAISQQINDAVNTAVKNYGSNFGWQPLIYPKGQMIIFNIPISVGSTTTSHQYVFNSLTMAPCRFKGLDAVCWGMAGNNIYFGKDDGTVWEFNGVDANGDDIASDGGSAIEGDGLPAFNYFGAPQVEKAFKLIEIIFDSRGDPAPALDMNTDYQIKAPTGLSTESVSTSGHWGVSRWGLGTWGTESQIFRGWRGIYGKGRAGSCRVRVSMTSSRPSWIVTNYTFVPGGKI